MTSALQPLVQVVALHVNPRGGVPKLPVEYIEVTAVGVVGDKQRDRRYHGGPRRAVSLFASELIEQLQAAGHPIDCGTTGENVTLRGANWATLTPGTRWRLGETVQLEITSYAAPCKTIAASFADGDSQRISQKLRPGQSRLYAAVLTPGVIHLGDVVRRDD